jgi:hypothetical protein
MGHCLSLIAPRAPVRDTGRAVLTAAVVSWFAWWGCVLLVYVCASWVVCMRNGGHARNTLCMTCITSDNCCCPQAVPVHSLWQPGLLHRWWCLQALGLSPAMPFDLLQPLVGLAYCMHAQDALIHAIRWRARMLGTGNYSPSPASLCMFQHGFAAQYQV